MSLLPISSFKMLLNSNYQICHTHCVDWWYIQVSWNIKKRCWRFLKKLRVDLPYDPAIPLLGIYPKNTKIQIWEDIYTPMSITARYGNNLSLLVDERIKKMWHIYTYINIHTYIYIYVYTHNGILLSHKKNEILPTAATWLDLEGIMLHEICQMKKDIYHVTSLICGI